MATDAERAVSKSEKSFSESPPGDWRLLNADIRASIAYAEALVGPGILTEAERDEISDGLRQIEADFKRGSFAAAPESDPFEAVEQRLQTAIGATASKLNAGRSRNEQLITALRLWLLEEMEFVAEQVADIQRALLLQAEGHVGALMPGYMHFQPAQVVSCSHWLLSYFWMLARDQDRLASAIGRASISPLGSSLLAGTPHRIDRRTLANAMGFSDVAANSMDAVSDMDFAADFLYTATMIGLHLSRLAEDLILYSNPALGFVTVDAKYSAGSALMASSRSAEAVELSRGRAGRLLGELTGFLSTLKSLPSTYNQDTLGNRAALYNAVDSLSALLNIMNGVVDTLEIHADRMLDALDESILTGDVVDYLVVRGVPFVEACTVVERLTARADKLGKPISELELEAFQAESRAFDAEVFALFDYTRSVAQRATIGGTAPAAIRTQIRQAMDWMVEAGLE